ncbi:MAG: MBL fold metallo-hydrolase RNA specificity domain-containing protein [Pirellulaceae bacterium]
MKVEFHGAARTVTGSKHLIHFQGKQLLLDCGMFQGRRKEAFRKNRNMPFDPRAVDAVVLSHAHIDHSGNLPSLVKGGFRGPIFATSASRDLAVHMLLDSAKIQQSDVKYVNRKRKRDGQTLFEPLYTQDDAVDTIKQMRCQDFGVPFEPIPGVTCQYYFAGHMLGAAIVSLEFTPDDGEPFRLVFSGDLGRSDVAILRDPEIIADADYLIMEATYGDRSHNPPGDTEAMLFKAAQETWKHRGKLIIPAFSVGRTQEIVYRLNVLFEENKLPPMQVFVDSPLAVNATTVFREHIECLNDKFIEQLLTEADQDPLGFRDLHYVRKVQDSKALNEYKKPCIIVSASGMCEAGRILHHLKNNIGKPNTTILFSGYQAPHTLGRRILEGEKRVRIYGVEYDVRANVMKLEGSSGHADQHGLLEWAKGIADAGSLKQVALVHCEFDPANEFRQQLQDAGIEDVIIPAPEDIMPLG